MVFNSSVLIEINFNLPTMNSSSYAETFSSFFKRVSKNVVEQTHFCPGKMFNIKLKWD